MEIEITGLNGGLFILAIGIALMGYFIGKGLQYIGRPDKGDPYSLLIKENELEFYLSLNKQEIKESLEKYPDAPYIELKGTKYYPYRQFMDWISSIDSTK